MTIVEVAEPSTAATAYSVRFQAHTLYSFLAGQTRSRSGGLIIILRFLFVLASYCIRISTYLQPSM